MQFPSSPQTISESTPLIQCKVRLGLLSKKRRVHHETERQYHGVLDVLDGATLSLAARVRKKVSGRTTRLFAQPSMARLRLPIAVISFR